MNSKHTLVMALIAIAGLSVSPSVRAEEGPSAAWQEAKKAFAPLNILRIGSSAQDKNTETGTTMRVFGIQQGKDLTVFPSNEKQSAEPQRSTPTIVSAPLMVEARAPSSSVEQAPLPDETVVRSRQVTNNTDLILLPVVEPTLTTQLASNQTGSRTAFATQAYLAEDIAQQSAAGEYVQSSGSVEWGEPVIGGGCCDSCCSGCCDSCCGCRPCCPPKIMVVGVEAVFLSPDINGTPVNYLYEDFTTPETVQFGPAHNNADLDDFYGAPRIWAGIQGCRWGIVGRYFHLRAGEHDHDRFDTTIVPPPTEHSYDVNSILEAYYADIELTRNFCLHGCKNQFTFGARYAALEHHESLFARSNVDVGILDAYARRNRTADGTGLTFSLNGRKPLFPCSCAHWFYNARGSVLWGESELSVESQANATATSGSLTGNSGAINGADVLVIDDDLFIAEFQVGLQWDFALRCLPAKAFFRTAFEYQYWDASTGIAGSASFAGIDSTSDYQVTAGSTAPGLIVDFVGLSIGSGFTW